MKNLLLIAFATLALAMGANIANACPNCEGKQVVKAEKKADKAEVKKTDKDANTDAVADVKEVKKDVKADKGCSSCAGATKASAGQLVKADRDTAGTCKSAAKGCGSGCGGCGGCAEKGECGGCDKAAKATKDCGGCEKKAEKVVKN